MRKMERICAEKKEQLTFVSSRGRAEGGTHPEADAGDTHDVEEDAPVVDGRRGEDVERKCACLGEPVLRVFAAPGAHC